MLLWIGPIKDIWRVHVFQSPLSLALRSSLYNYSWPNWKGKSKTVVNFLLSCNLLSWLLYLIVHLDPYGRDGQKYVAAVVVFILHYYIAVGLFDAY